jgi:hypothetical protein
MPPNLASYKKTARFWHSERAVFILCDSDA